MVSAGAIAFVFGAGLVTALATGLGAIPFFLFGDISDRWNVALWGIASGIMLAASGFGLLNEGLAASSGFPSLLLAGTLAGVVLVIIAGALLNRVDLHNHSHDHHDTPEEEASMHRSDGGYAAGATESENIPSEDAPAVSAAIAEGDLRKLVLILGVLTVHSFPEGVAIGVSFAELGLEGGVELFGLVVPVLAIFMTIAISIHNIPEGTAISIPLRAMDVSEWKMVWWAVFSSLPQPIGAVIAFAFVRTAREFLPYGFGFAAGAMIYLVLTEFIPEALDLGSELPRGGKPELLSGIALGVLLMLPLAFI